MTILRIVRSMPVPQVRICVLSIDSVRTDITGVRENAIPTNVWRTPVVVWAAFVRWDYSLRVGVFIKGYTTIL